MRSIKILLIFLLIALLQSNVLRGQNSSDENTRKTLKSAYILNFIKLIQWENESSLNSIKIAIYEDTLTYRIFKNELQNKSIREKLLKVYLVKKNSDLTSYQVIFVSEKNNPSLSELFQKYYLNHLIVSEEAGTKFSMIDFYFNDNKLKFELNENNISNAKLKADKYLLSLSITDVSRLQHIVAETEQQLRGSQTAVETQQGIIKQQQDVIKSQIEDINAKVFDLKKKEDDLAKLNYQIEKLNQDIVKQSVRSSRLELDIRLKENDLVDKLSQLELMKKEKGIKEQQIKRDRLTLFENQKGIKKTQLILLNLQQQVQKNKDLLNSKEKIIENNQLRIEKQNYLILTSIVSIIFIVAFTIFVLRSNRINKIANKKLLKQNLEIELQAKILKEKSEMINEQNEELLQINEELYEAKKQTEISENNLKEAQKIGNVGHWEYDQISDKLHWSEQTFQIYEIEKNSFTLTNQNITEFIHPEDRLKVKDALDFSLKSKDNFEFEHRIITPTGKIKYLIQRVRTKYNQEGKPVSTIGSIADITELKQIELVIQEQNSELEELNRTKDKFFSIIAHDLKNPFNSMIGLSSILMSYSDSFDKEKIVEISKMLNEAAKNGYGLLENLLEWSRSQSGRIVYHPVSLSLSEIVTSSIKQVESIAIKKEIEIRSTVNDQIKVLGDLNMLNTVIRNLISNAIKYSNKKSSIIISSSDIDDRICLSVKDSGVGIPSDVLSKLFKIEVKNSTPGTEDETGTGLGLILCKEFVEKHGGTIWAESEEGKGSSFSFTLTRDKF